MILPMMAKSQEPDFLKKIENDQNLVVSTKIDGFREMLYLGSKRNSLLTRNLTEHIEKVPQFQIVIPELASTVIDCEGIAPTSRLADTVSCFNSLPETAIAWQKIYGNAKLVMFDVLRYRGKDIVGLPFRERRQILVVDIFLALVRYGIEDIYPEALVRESKYNFYREIVEDGGEGVMVKDLRAFYHPDMRTDAWLKIKRIETHDYIITGFTEGTGKYSDVIGAVEYGIEKGGEFITLGRSSGMTDAERVDMANHPEKYIGKIAEFHSQSVSVDLVMRHPRYMGLKKDR